MHVTLCDPMDFSQPDSSVHEILQARILEWVANSSSKGSYLTRDEAHIFSSTWTGTQVLYHQPHLNTW